MTGADGDLFVSTFLRPILVITLKEESFEFTMKIKIAAGEFFIVMLIPLQHLAP